MSYSTYFAPDYRSNNVQSNIHKQKNNTDVLHEISLEFLYFSL
jgi:hypothetical protein